MSRQRVDGKKLERAAAGGIAEWWTDCALDWHRTHGGGGESDAELGATADPAAFRRLLIAARSLVRLARGADHDEVLAATLPLLESSDGNRATLHASFIA